MENSNVQVGPISCPEDVVDVARECEQSLFQQIQEKLAASSTVSEEDLGPYFDGILKESEIRGQAVYIAHKGELQKIYGVNGQLSLVDMEKLLGDFHEANNNERQYLISAMLENSKKLLEEMNKHNSAQSAAAVGQSQGITTLVGGAATPLSQGDNSHGRQQGLGNSGMGGKLPCQSAQAGIPPGVNYSEEQAMRSMHRALNGPVEGPIFRNTESPAQQPPPPPVPRGRGRPRKYTLVSQAPNSGGGSSQKLLQGQKQDGVQGDFAAQHNTSTQQSQTDTYQQQMQTYQMQQQYIQQQMEQDMQQRVQRSDRAALEGSIDPELRGTFQQVMQRNANDPQYGSSYASTSANSTQALVSQQFIGVPVNVGSQLFPDAAASGAVAANIVRGSHERSSMGMGETSMNTAQAPLATTAPGSYPGTVQSQYGAYSMHGPSMAHPQVDMSSFAGGYPDFGSSSRPCFMGENALAQTSMPFYSDQPYGSQFARPPAPPKPMSSAYYTYQGGVSQASGRSRTMDALATAQISEQPPVKRQRTQARPQYQRAVIMPRADMQELRAATDPATQNAVQTLPNCTRTMLMAQVNDTDIIIEWPKPAGGEFYVLTCPMPGCSNRTFETPKGMSVHMTQGEIDHAHAMGTNRSHNRVVEITGVKVVDATPEAVTAHNAIAKATNWELIHGPQ